MTKDTVSVTVKCPSCGADPATLELPDNYTDNSMAKCKRCNADIGRYGDIKAKAVDAVRKDVVAAFRKAFK